MFRSRGQGSSPSSDSGTVGPQVAVFSSVISSLGRISSMGVSSGASGPSSSCVCRWRCTR